MREQAGGFILPRGQGGRVGVGPWRRGRRFEAQENALRYLREAQTNESASDMAQGMGQSIGRPAAGTVQRFGSGGFSGVENRPVRIPRADEYKPRREFREDC